MYYVHILAALLSGHGQTFAPFFRIRHILPPYALYYYGLLALSSIMPMLLADRVLICLYLVSFVFGFRYLARAIGPSADRMTLLATLLLLNWPLGMGFVNFCLALSFSFWAAGLWLRVLGTPNVRARIIFFLLVTATMLTHPVPLLLLLAVAGTLWLAHGLNFTRSNQPHTQGFTLPPHATADLATLALASLNVGYVKLFANANPLRQSRDVVAPSLSAQILGRVRDYYGHQHALAFVLGHRADLAIYHIALVATVIVPALLASRQWLRNHRSRQWTAGDTFLLLAILGVIALPLMPSQLNGSYYFADRLLLCDWLAFLLAASGFIRPSTASAPTSSWLWIAFALIANASLLTASDRLVRPAARATAALEHATIAPPGQRGLMLEDPRDPIGGAREELSWNPYTWALAHLFRHSNAILANPPWMDVSIIPIGGGPSLPQLSIPALQEPIPTSMQGALLNSPADLARAFQVADFFVVNDFDHPPLNSPEPLLATPATARQRWTCTSHPWYRVCSRPPASFTP